MGNEGASLAEALPPAVIAVVRALAAAGIQAYVVGGAVRDALLGLECKDIDLECYGTSYARLADVVAPLGRVNLVGRRFGILKLAMADGQTYDISLPRRENKHGVGHRGFDVTVDPTMTPREAAARRDFTWNALALDPLTGRILDYFGGRRDLAARRIRHTSAAFAEDPLRVLRAMQFAARFDFSLDPATAALCRQLVPEAGDLALERVWEEWRKWAVRGIRPSAGLVALRQSGWLECYPELAALIGCPQEPEWHPEGDVWTHTLLVCDQAAHIAAREGLHADDRLALLLAALCHDLGKPATTYVDPGSGRIRSDGHATAGIEPARRFLARIGCPPSLYAPVECLVIEHMSHIGLPVEATPVRRLANRLARLSGGAITIGRWSELVEADHSGRPPLPPGNPAAPLRILAEQLAVADRAPIPLITGRHIMDYFGLPQGKQVGRLKALAFEGQQRGAFADVAAGLAWLAEQAPGGHVSDYTTPSTEGPTER